MFVYLFAFTFGGAGPSLLCVALLCGRRRLLSTCSAWASHCGGFSCGGAGALGHAGFSSWSTRAQQCQLPGSRMYTHIAGMQVKLVLCAQLCPTILRPVSCSPWEFPGKNTGVDGHILLQGIFLTQGSNLCFPCLLHCRRILYSSVVVAHGLSLFSFNVHITLKRVPYRRHVVSCRQHVVGSCPHPLIWQISNL